MQARQQIIVIIAVTFMLCSTYLLTHKNESFTVKNGYQNLKKLEKDYSTFQFESDISTTNLSYDEFMATRFAKRYKRMYKGCNTTEPPTKFVPIHNILVNENHHLEVCPLSKGGSSSWHMLMQKLRHLDNGEPPPVGSSSAIWLFNRRTSFKIQNKKPFDNWTKGVDDNFFTDPNPQKVYRIIAGRHPFARLISAWNQKFWTASQPKNHFYQIYSSILRYYNSVTPDENHVISWEDFARYIADIPRYDFELDHHFAPAYMFCEKCNYFYTYVVKLESLAEDYDWLSRRINLPSDIEMIHVGTGPNGSVVNADPGGKIRECMKRLPHDTVLDLYEMYKNDFDDFGYTFDLDTYNAGGFDS